MKQINYVLRQIWNITCGSYFYASLDWDKEWEK